MEIANLCCICLQHKNFLRRLVHLFQNTNYYSALVLLFPEMNSTVLYDQGTICAECCIKMDYIWNFRDQCLQNSQVFINYTTQSSVSETHCGTNETSQKNDQNSALETDEQENENADGATDAVIDENIIKTEELNIKLEPEDIIGSEEDDLESTPVTNNVNQELLETFDTSSIEDLSQYNYHTIFVFNEEGNIKSIQEVKDHKTYSNRKSRSDRKYKKRRKQTNTLNQCNICLKTFTTRNGVVKHKRVHFRKASLTCYWCGKTFLKLAAAITHERLHSGLNPFKCDQCDKSFKKLTHLNQHKRVHSGEKPFHCDHCNKTFTQLSQFNVHKRSLGSFSNVSNVTKRFSPRLQHN